MNSYYGTTVAAMGVALAAVTAAALFANSAAAEARRRHSRAAATVNGQLDARRAQRQTVLGLEQAIGPARRFAAAWHRSAKLPGRQPAESIRTDIEAIAQRQLGLITDGAITPQPERHTFAGAPIAVQRVTLRASGRDLAALLTWLGNVEEKYPLALVELCEFSSNVGGNTGLTIRIAQPLEDPTAVRSPVFHSPEGVRTNPALIAATSWSEYMPPHPKAPVAIGFQRNPLQPAVVPDARVSPGKSSDALAAKIEAAVAGQLHSVVRGAIPIINVQGRLFRVGDELAFGNGREKPVRDAQTKLKQIGADQLVFHVSGGTAERPVECDVAYKLPPFFEAR